jgi:hypothetical protein
MKNSVCVLNLKRSVLVCAVLLACNAGVFAQWTTSGNDIYTTNSNDVRIGMSPYPCTYLTIGSDTYLHSRLTLKPNPNKPGTSNKVRFISEENGDNAIIYSINEEPGKNYLVIQAGYGEEDYIVLANSLNSLDRKDVMNIYRSKVTIPDSNLCVGTATPQTGYKLTVAGDAYMNGHINTTTISATDVNMYNLNASQNATITGNLTANGTTKLQTTAIGTSTPLYGYMLTVDGKVICEELKVQMSQDWPDYVFEPDYPLMPLAKLESYVTQQKHLPGIAPAAEVEKNGMEVSHMQTKLLEKVEELTLYVIQLKKENDQLKTENSQIQNRIAALEKKLK